MTRVSLIRALVFFKLIGGNFKSVNNIPTHEYAIGKNVVTAQSRSLSVTTLLNEGSFCFVYKFLFGRD